MSPSEEKGRKLGIELVVFDRLDRVVARQSGALVRYSYLSRFRTTHNGRRCELQAAAKSRAGAWRVAVRWLRQLQKGKV